MDLTDWENKKVGDIHGPAPHIRQVAERNGYPVYECNGKFILWTYRISPTRADVKYFTADSIEQAYRQKS